MILMTSIIGSWTILFFGYKIGMDSNENNLLREGNAYTFTCDMRLKEELNVKCTLKLPLVCKSCFKLLIAILVFP